MSADHHAAVFPVPSRRPEWQTPVLVLGILALAGTLPFWVTDLDLQVASLFHHPEADDPWPEGRLPLWSFLYRAAPVVTGMVLVGGILVLGAAAIWDRARPLRLYAVLVLATVLTGPGLLVNAVFKDHWGRPRPHQVEALGGTKVHVPPLLPTASGGSKSFPCGHSSVGFSLGVFYLIWRRRRPRLAWAALIGSLALGTLLGIGRMAAGDHFLSDVIWSWVIAYGVALALYYGLFRVPEREAQAPARIPRPTAPTRRHLLAVSGYGLLALVLLTGVLLATPINQDTRQLIHPGAFHLDPRVLQIEADDLDLFLHGIKGPEVGQIRLQARGFGLPNAEVERDLTVHDGVVSFRVRHRGLFTERDTKLVVGLIPDHWARIEVRLGRGDIRVLHLESSDLALDLLSEDGSVLIEPSTEGPVVSDAKP